MSAEDVRRALELMDDPAVRVRIAEGLLSDLGAATFDAYETTLVREAAADYPEVSGFSFAGVVGSASELDALDARSPYGRAVLYALPEEARRRK
jgi:hypothetical protein